MKRARGFPNQPHTHTHTLQTVRVQSSDGRAQGSTSVQPIHRSIFFNRELSGANQTSFQPITGARHHSQKQCCQLGNFPNSRELSLLVDTETYWRRTIVKSHPQLMSLTSSEGSCAGGWQRCILGTSDHRHPFSAAPQNSVF